MRSVLVIFLALVAACLMVVRKLDKSAEASTPDVLGASGPEEAQEILKLVEVSYRILKSDEFANNFIKLETNNDVLYTRRGPIYMSPREVLESLRFDSLARPVPVKFVIVGQDRNSSDWYRAATSPGGYLTKHVRIYIGRGNLSEFDSADIVERSCAINTMAHELSHSVFLKDDPRQSVFTDTTPRDDGIGDNIKGAPIATYAIGTVAQCTYLQMEGRLRADEFLGCVEVFGIKSFHSPRCKEFSLGQPVVYSRSLSPPAPDV
ncbi:MAG: hypothetical protein ACK41C_14230 [Phenylobacterium sp.]|uniref:hypothetical protein n=1 Tax=Phenylobacterium sp. TaxID=1871053 RepID=UPI00391C51B9